MRKLFLAAMSGLMMLGAGPASAAVVLNYSSITNAVVQFNGDGTFTFNPVSGNDFRIGSSSGGTGDAVNKTGRILGTFTIGAGDFSAPVTSSGGIFKINDGGGNWFTADLVWNNIFEFGALGGLNLFAQANLANVAYTGSNEDLHALASFQNGATTLSFQFASPYTLDQLRTERIFTSYSGSLISVPEAGALLLFGTGLIGLVGYRRSRRMQ